MANDLGKIGVVILAAGKGKRMDGKLPLPKVLYPLVGKPIMSYLLKSLEKSEIQTKPVIVVSPDGDVIKQTFGEKYNYAIQESQLGTGHAVLSAKEKLQDFDHILVLYGDHPFLSSNFINQFTRTHLKTGATLTMATVLLPDFLSWRQTFTSFGRIVRNDSGYITRIIEAKDANRLEIDIKEVLPGFFCFKGDWLWQNLPKLSRHNAQNEYYLTDLIKVAIGENQKVQDVKMTEAKEAMGVNTLEQLSFAEQSIES